MEVILYKSNEGCINELESFWFRDWMVLVVPMNGGRFPQLILQSKRRKAETPSMKMASPTPLGGYYILSLPVRVRRWATREIIDIVSGLQHEYADKLMWTELVRDPE